MLRRARLLTHDRCFQQLPYNRATDFDATRLKNVHPLPRSEANACVSDPTHLLLDVKSVAETGTSCPPLNTS
jgi:hypothetical protein